MGDFTDALAAFDQAHSNALQTATGATAPPVDSSAAPPPAPDNGYTEALRGFDALNQTRARQAVTASAGSNPDAVAKAQDLAPKVGVPAPVVEQDPAAWQQQADLQHAQGVVDGNPALQQWLAANPESARLAADDYDRLDMVSKAWRALSGGWGEAFLSDERGRLGAQLQLGSDAPAALARVQDIESKLEASPQLGGLYGVLKKTAGFAGGLVDNFLHAAPYAAAGAGGGAIAGGAAVPAIGAIPGAVGGFTIGTGVGFKWDMARVSAGNTYLDLGKLRGSDGQPIAEGARQAASLLVGLGTYAIAGVGASRLGAAYEQAATSLWGDAVKQAVTVPTVQRSLGLFATRLAVSGVEGASLNAALEGTSIFGEELAKQLSSGNWDTVFNDPVKRQEAIDRVMSSAIDGAYLFPLAKLPAAGVSLVGDTLRARQAQSDVGVLQNLENGAAASKVRGRSLGAFQDFLRLQAQGSPVENLMIPGDRVRELYQSMGVEPGDGDPLMGFVPDIKDQLAQAERTGGDVVVPTADYIAHLAGTPAADALRPDLRVRPDGMTLREAQEYAANRDAYMAENSASLRAQMDHEASIQEPVRQIFEDTFSKLRSAGYTADVARQYATLIGARYSARAERLGGGESPLSLYQKEGLQVRRVLPEGLAALPVDDRDMVINALRNNSRMPADRQLFGPSMLEAIKEGGGIIDTGGEIKALDLDKVKGMRGLIKPARGAMGENEMKPDAWARILWERGYFPESAERPTADDLFEALRDEQAGKRHYANGSEDERRASFKAAVEDLDKFLGERGLDVKTASNDEIKRAIVEHQEETQGREFGQEVTPGAAGDVQSNHRGKITLENGRAVVSLFKGADLSTFLHEMGHLSLEELQRDAAGEGAPAQLKEDLAKVRDWLGAKDGIDLTTEQHEQFARGFERYLMEGKAPSAALATAFSRFKAWLLTIYRHLVNLRAPISDEIRGVMDRLLASDNEIDQARKGEGLNPVFKSAEDAGMTKPEFAAYTRGVERARAVSEQRLLSRTMEQVRKLRAGEWKAQEGDVRADVESEVKSRPDLRAQYWLRTGKMLDNPDAEPELQRMKLSRDMMRETFGNDEAPGLLPKGTFANKGGADPDEVAELFGYRSGEDLVRALMSLEAQRRQAVERTGRSMDGAAYVQHLVDAETERRMLERHGDAMSDGSIEEEAMRAVHSAAQADVMATELRFLARSVEAHPPFTLDQLRAWANSEIAGMDVGRGIDAARFGRAEAKAARDVERALLAGDVAAAFEAKQRQLVNHLLTTEADRIAEEYDRAQKMFSRFAAKPVFATIDQAYTDRIHELLQRFGFPTKRGEAELRGGLGKQTLEGFIGAKEAQGREVVMPSFLLDPRFAKPVEEMTVDQFLGLKDAVESLAHNGREEKRITVEGQRLAFDDFVGEAVAAVEKLPQRKAPKEINPGTGSGFRGNLERLTTLMRFTNSRMMKEENIFDWLDGRDPNGAFNRIFKRLKDGQHKENDMLQSVSADFAALKDKMSKDWQKSLGKFMTIPELPERGEGKRWRKQDVLAMALNSGNEGNLDKLARGYGWSRDSIKAVLDREMTGADWQFVQGTWDIFEKLYPEIEAMTRRMTGVGPEKVEAIPVDTRFGSFRGGYFPVVYDPLKSHTAEMHGQRAAAQMFENGYFRATTPKGHTIARVQDYAAPIRLSLDVIPFKLRQAVHDLAFREAIMDADKFLADPRIREAVDGSLGHEYTQMFRPWLQSIANEANIDDKGLAGLDWLARQARVNVTQVGVGFRVLTMFKHGSTALFNSFGEIGPKWMGVGAREFFGPPQKMQRQLAYALERSGELRHRVNSIDRDVRESLRTLQGQSGLRAAAVRYGHYGIAMLDMGSAVPTWFGAYRKAMSEGMVESDAVYAADKAVRNAHGAQGSLDLAAVQRGGEMAKLFTMFYGFFNHIYNRQVDTVRMAGEGTAKLRAGDYAGAKRDFAMVLARSFYYLAIPAVVEAMASHGGPDEDNGEGWGGWALKAILAELPAGLPIIRDIAKAAIDGRGYEMSPVGKAVDNIIHSGKDMASLFGWRDAEPSERWLQHAIESAGYVFGLPTGQGGATTQYLWDVMQGDEEPAGLGEFMHGLLYGKPPKT